MTIPTCRSCGTHDPARAWVTVGNPEIWLCQPKCVSAHHLQLRIGDRVHTVHPWEADGRIVDLPGPELAVVLADDGRKAQVDLYHVTRGAA
jgi:hypothetical protein